MTAPPSPSLLTLNDGNKAPWLAFGTGTAQFSKDVSNIVRVALLHGFVHIDTAQGYQNEQSVGEGIKLAGVRRDDIFITTKLGRLDDGETVESTLRRSLAKLGVDYVDLFLVHTPTHHLGVGRLKEVWKGMVDVKRKGLTKSIGVSNFALKHLKEILADGDEAPTVNQVSPTH
jgi:diketogulonate reductase-like aldo/keto reductase